MHRTATRFGLIVAVAIFAAAKAPAQKAASTAGPHLEPNAGGEEAAVKRVVEGIMLPYLAQEQHTAGGHLWRRSPDLGTIVAVSLHGHRYFFTYGKATDWGAPFTRETLVEIRSCTKTFTTTLFALAINRNQIVPDASAQKYMPHGYTLRAQQLTPLELADFTSGMPDDPTNLPRGLERRSIEYYTVKDFLTWASNYEPRTQLPAPYKYSNAGIGLLSYLVATATGNEHGENCCPISDQRIHQPAVRNPDENHDVGNTIGQNVQDFTTAARLPRRERDQAVEHVEQEP
jgi:CubicO group peptidase (beta-lactamase class C family)